MVANKMAVFLFCFYFVLIFSRLSLVSAPAFGDWNVASSQQCHQEGEAASSQQCHQEGEAASSQQRHQEGEAACGMRQN